ncbi:hypothetical protein DFH09DRAFT_1362685 [Mycena vulgaris]|nr:hypothetical protein DFH09DRAFT_1362685 [Mycena vulgaris]
MEGAEDDVADSHTVVSVTWSRRVPSLCNHALSTSARVGRPTRRFALAGPSAVPREAELTEVDIDHDVEYPQQVDSESLGRRQCRPRPHPPRLRRADRTLKELCIESTSRRLSTSARRQFLCSCILRGESTNARAPPAASDCPCPSSIEFVIRECSAGGGCASATVRNLAASSRYPGPAARNAEARADLAPPAPPLRTNTSHRRPRGGNSRGPPRASSLRLRCCGPRVFSLARTRAAGPNTSCSRRVARARCADSRPRHELHRYYNGRPVPRWTRLLVCGICAPSSSSSSQPSPSSTMSFFLQSLPFSLDHRIPRRPIGSAYSLSPPVPLRARAIRAICGRSFVIPSGGGPRVFCDGISMRWWRCIVQGRMDVAEDDAEGEDEDAQYQDAAEDLPPTITAERDQSPLDFITISRKRSKTSSDVANATLGFIQSNTGFTTVPASVPSTDDVCVFNRTILGATYLSSSPTHPHTCADRGEPREARPRTRATKGEVDAALRASEVACRPMQRRSSRAQAVLARASSVRQRGEWQRKSVQEAQSVEHTR